MNLPLSICMIVKNEEAVLANCLGSVKDIASEIIVVDTGSTDNTKEIAESFGAKVYDFEWVNDFSAARNESFKYATQDWILIMDADLVMEEYNYPVLKNCLENPNIHLYYVFWLEKDLNIQHPMIHLFRNLPEIKSEGRIHEQITFDPKKYKIAYSDILINHSGYADEDNTKFDRNTELIELSLKYDNLSASTRLRMEIYLFFPELKNYSLNENNALIEKIFKLNDLIKNSDDINSSGQFFEKFYVASLYFLFKINNIENFFRLLIDGLRLFPTSINFLFYLSKWFFNSDNYYKSVIPLELIIYLVKNKSLSCYVFENKKEFLDFDYLNYHIALSYYEVGDYQACKAYINKIVNPANFHDSLNMMIQSIEGKNSLSSKLEAVLSENPSYSFNYFRVGREYIKENKPKNEITGKYLKGLELATQEQNYEIQQLIISDLILHANSLNLDNSFIDEIIIKGGQIPNNKPYYWYCLGSYYMSLNNYALAVKALESAYKSGKENTDLIFNRNEDDKKDFSQVNFFINESQYKSFLNEQILTGIKECLGYLLPGDKI